MLRISFCCRCRMANSLSSQLKSMINDHGNGVRGDGHHYHNHHHNHGTSGGGSGYQSNIQHHNHHSSHHNGTTGGGGGGGGHGGTQTRSAAARDHLSSSSSSTSVPHHLNESHMTTKRTAIEIWSREKKLEKIAEYSSCQVGQFFKEKISRLGREFRFTNISELF